MSVDPKEGGKCWSCKFCEDIGTQTFEDYVAYVRKCTKPDKEHIDNCDHNCEEYLWDGHTTEYWKQSDSAPAQPQFQSARSSSVSDNSAARWVIPLIAAILVLLIGVVILLIKSSRPAPQEDPLPSETATAAPTELPTETVLQLPSYETRIVRTNSGAGLNLREKPNTTAEVVVLMDFGAQVNLLQERGDWAYVQYGEHTGWCSMKYLVTEAQAQEPLAPEAGEDAVTAVVMTESGNLRLRETPSSNAEIIGALPKGAVVTVVKESGDWSYVEYQGEAGWCASKFLSIG